LRQARETTEMVNPIYNTNDTKHKAHPTNQSHAGNRRPGRSLRNQKGDEQQKQADTTGYQTQRNIEPTKKAKRSALLRVACFHSFLIHADVAAQRADSLEDLPYALLPSGKKP